jgi:hypothetical protein
MQLLGDSGSTLLESVSCALTDDGVHAISPDIWTQWPYADILTVKFGRVNVSDRTLPHNRSRAEAVGVSWQFGALSTY